MANPRTLTVTMSDTISYKERSGVDAAGKPTYGTLTTAAAKVWDRQDVFRNNRGEEVVTRSVVHTFTDVPRGSLLWLPGEDTTDNDNAHIVDYTYKHVSCGARGSQWTLYEIKIEMG